MNNHAPARGSRITARDLELLGFISEHRIVVAEHARRFLGVSLSVAYARLRALTSAGLLTRNAALHGHPSCYLATRQGLRAAETGYRAQRIDLSCFQHDLGVASLGLAAAAGTFGPVREVVSERSMRSRDAPPTRAGAPLGVRLGGLGPAGRERLHYPDLLLITPDSRRIALELELTSKGVARREKILSGYAFDRQIDAVVYLVQNRAVGRKIQQSARRIGISSLVHVQLVAGLPGGRDRGSALARSSARRREERIR